MALDHDELTVIVNNPIQLLCEVTGIPPPVISWRKAGEVLALDKLEGVIFLPNGALRFNRVTVDDGGMYECVATSIAGTATKVISLNVQGTR